MSSCSACIFHIHKFVDTYNYNFIIVLNLICSKGILSFFIYNDSWNWLEFFFNLTPVADILLYYLINLINLASKSNLSYFLKYSQLSHSVCTKIYENLFQF